MKRIKEILISALALTVIAAAVNAALSATNALTKDTIAAATAAAENEARRQVIDATDFEEATVTVDGETVTYHKALKDGQTVGYVFRTVASGKSSGLTVMTGIGTDGVITGVNITDDNETAGYVDKVKKGGLLDQFIGKTAQPFKVKENVDAVSQATKTSTGVTKAVDTAVRYYKAIGGEAA